MPLKFKAPAESAPTRPATQCSVGDVLEFLYPGVADGDPLLDWPPDVFALATCVLHRSGAYTYVVRGWPPKPATKITGASATVSQWKDLIRKTGERWRHACVSHARPPQEILNWWNCVTSHVAVPLSDILRRHDLCEALLQLCAAADEACNGVGIPSGDGSPGNPFEMEANQILADAGTLCKRIHSSRARVLPKLHTPQNGLTIRSISHNLALISGGEIEPAWYIYPRPQRDCVTLLLIPWPELVYPGSFRAATPRTGSLRNMPREFGFFEYQHQPASSAVHRHVSQMLALANESVGKIDGVIFPELALTPAEYDQVSRSVLGREAFLISGIADRSAGGRTPGRNCLGVDFPYPGGLRFPLRQQKHHRWRLDKSQIRQYGLGSRLDPQTNWWEYISVERRTLAFIAMKPWLTLTALICEDLARQDPMADVVRSVGPNLVIALLMDAPQLASRWPARYATVLADDPGSSVLTLTSIGMAELSRPPNTPLRPRVIALWKDARNNVPIEIEIPQGRHAAVLSLTVEMVKEFTADGRDDDEASGYPVLSGVHFV